MIKLLQMDKRRALVAWNDCADLDAIAEGLIDCGVSVSLAGAVNYRPRMDELSQRLMKLGAACMVFNFPKNNQQIPNLVHQIEQKAGPIDIFINGTGHPTMAPIADISETSLQEALSKDLCLSMALCRAVAIKMMQRARGAIVNMTTGFALRGIRNGTLRCSCDAAMHMFTKSLALETADKGVRVNAVGTGWMDSDWLPEQIRQDPALLRHMPLRRLGQPDELAATVAFLVSDASAFITGQTFFLDGGAMIHA